MATHTGGCICGEVRYEVEGEPEMCLFCYCDLCTKRIGTDGYGGAMFPESGFKRLQGEPSSYATVSDAGRTVHRFFCGNCGSHLWGETELGLVSIAAGSLDDPSVFKPEGVVFTEDAPPWARIPDFG